MDNKKTFGNLVMIKLDAENDKITLLNGPELYLDIQYEPEKHATVTGTVCGLPSHLYYSGEPNKGMPWKCPMELKYGDRVVVYYLAVMNALRKESLKAMIIDGERYVWIPYQNIFAAVREGLIVPINGYCLIEPCQNPEHTAVDERMAKVNILIHRGNTKSNVNVVYGRVKYLGRPNEEYADGHSDDGVGIHAGDIVVMKRISDLPLEYDLHAKIDSGKKNWRVQRRNILAKL